MTTKPKLIKLAKPALILAPKPELINPALIEICRRDFPSFATLCAIEVNHNIQPSHNFHFDALAFRLERVIRGQYRTLIANLPPRHGKSTYTSVAAPAYILGHDPTQRIIVYSSNLDLAVALANDHRKVLNSSWYKAMFQTRISPTKNTEREIVTTRGGYRLAASLDPGVMGRGANYLFFDDPINAADIYSESKRQRTNHLIGEALLRLDNPTTGAVVMAMQRLHMDDPCAFLSSIRKDADVLKLAAIAEEDEKIQIAENLFHLRRAGEALYPEIGPISKLNELKFALGSARFAAEYQQCPESLEGLFFKREWPRRYDHMARADTSLVYQSWDTAFKNGKDNDYSVCVTLLLQDKKYFVIDVVRERVEYPDLIKLAIAQAQKHRPARVLIEDCGLGTPLRGELERAGFPAIGVKPHRDKKTRMRTQSAKFEQGLVYLPREAIWLFDFEAELFSVPNARHDDQVDALCQALEYMTPGSSGRWDDISLRNFGNFVEALAFDKYFGLF